MWQKALYLPPLTLGLCTLAYLTWQAYTHPTHPHSDKTPIVARVHDQYLYKTDLEHITASANHPTEKAKLAEQYLQSWIAKQLLIAEAEAHTTHHKADIERKVLDYRYALLVHNHIEQLVNAQLDREVPDAAIEAYYKANQENFTLRTNIIKGQFVIIPRDAPKQAQLRKHLQAHSNQNHDALKTYCFQYAKDYSLDPTNWLQWDDLIQSTPLSNTPNKAKLLKNRKLIQTHDTTYSYYIKIKDHRTVNDTPPLPFVRDQIKDIIIYKRKIQLANKIKADILQKAQKDNHYTIYEN